MPRTKLVSLVAALSFGLGAAAADAEPATPEGAKAIEAAYAAYFSKAAIDKGVIAVAPQGEDYIVTWDLGKAIAAAGGRADVLTAAPFSYRISPTVGGGYIVRAAGLPTLTIRPTGRDDREGGSIAFDGFQFDGLYDPSAPDFWRGKLSLGAVKIDVKTRSGEGLQHLEIADNGVAGEMRTGGSVDKDGVDIHTTQAIESATQRVTDVADGEETLASETRQGAAAGDGSVDGLRAAAFGDLWRFLVAAADSGPPPPEALRPKLEALLPLWRKLAGRAGLDDLALTFPGGGVTIKSLAEEIDMTGLAADASAEFVLALQDMSVALDAAPDWAKSIWPASLQLRVVAGVAGLDRAARLALGDPELVNTGNIGDQTKDEIARTLREGHPHVTITETRLVTPLVEATFEGEAEFAADGPQAHAKVTADDLDKVLQLLAKASEDDPQAQQALFVATFAKGLAKSEDGRLVWDIAFAPPNSVIVNGQRLGPE